MYFPGDPLFALDPIYQSIVDQDARDRLVAAYDHDRHQARMGAGLQLGHRADRVEADLDRTGRWRRMSKPPKRASASDPGQTVGPFYGYALPYEGGRSCGPRHPRLHPAPRHRVRRRGRAGPGRDPGDLAGRRRRRRSPQRAGSLVRDGYTFTGFGRTATDATGLYQFTTVSPGRSRRRGAVLRRRRCSPAA